MKRRQFLRTGGAAVAALSGFHRYAEALADARLRVGVIGTGWYGKCNLFRLLQVAPVEVVSLCDVDSAMLGTPPRRWPPARPRRGRPGRTATTGRCWRSGTSTS